MSPYVRLGTYVKMGTRTYRILPSKVRRYVSWIKLPHLTLGCSYAKKDDQTRNTAMPLNNCAAIYHRII